jgi:hypothetical protein
VAGDPRALERALAPNGDEAAAASGVVELFRLLAEEVEPLLDERQHDVIDYALAASRSRG